MTTLPITSPTARTRTPAAPSGAWRAGLPQTIRAEWTKLVTLRSTKWTLLITAVGTVLVTFLASNSVPAPQQSVVSRGSTPPTRLWPAW